MPCRVGITTNPQRRRSDWENQVVGLTNWRILAQYRTKSKAQEHENRYAARIGCLAHAGGPDTPGIWHVYRFDYIRTR